MTDKTNAATTPPAIAPALVVRVGWVVDLANTDLDTIGLGEDEVHGSMNEVAMAWNDEWVFEWTCFER